MMRTSLIAQSGKKDSKAKSFGTIKNRPSNINFYPLVTNKAKQRPDPFFCILTLSF